LITQGIDNKKLIVGTPAGAANGDKTATLKTNANDPNVREVRYTVYGENLE
jgi:hypothetical protein